MVMSEVVEAILLRCLVKDLVRCKSVCKSWYSLISSPSFAKTHVKFICNKEEGNISRRIAMIDPWVTTPECSFIPSEWHPYARWSMQGSCNGLVCIYSSSEARICVTNALTREFRELQQPLNFYQHRRCLGFGYDSSTDDYKVVMAIPERDDLTLVFILSLKSNIWKLFGHVNYIFADFCMERPGILFNGALHWFWFGFDRNHHTKNSKVLIVSFDLVKEEFREIPQPGDSRYVWNYHYTLGIMDGSLCIFPNFPSCGTWVMKSYNSWELFPKHCEMKRHAIHYMLKDTDEDRITPPPTYFCDENIKLSRSKEHIQSPMFVQTVVSPYLDNGGPTHSKNNKSTANAESVQEEREIEEVYSVDDKEEKNKSSFVIEMVLSDVVEEILFRLQEKDLLRCTSVCKSWYSLITNPSFVKSHCKFMCNKEEYSRRKIDMITYSCNNWEIEGSSNGLVCLYWIFRSRICVTNPVTRVFRELQPPPKITTEQCFGFGYDSSTDDYKVLLAISQQDKALVQILSLKSNVWKHFGQVNYRFDDSALAIPGILFNGALHWFWLNPDDTTRQNILLVSFDLAKEEFREIPQPDDPRYVWNYDYSLGIIQGHLCIFPAYDEDVYPSCGIWVMKSYNSWKLFPNESQFKDYAIHYMLKDNIQSTLMPTYFCDENKQLSKGKEHIGSPMFVRTLVSPYVNNNDGPSPRKSNKRTDNVKEKREIEEVYSMEDKEEEEFLIGLLEVEGTSKQEFIFD